jgi:hypothetical protein
MTRARFRTDYRLWTVAALCLFVALGFLDPLAGAWWKGDASLWHEVGSLVRGEYASGVSGALPYLLLYAGLLIGWLVQAAVVIVRVSTGAREAKVRCQAAGGVCVERSAPPDRPRA